MDDDENLKLTLVSKRSDEEIERDEVLRDIAWPTREFVANLLRVIRGAGKPYMLVSQLFDLTKTLANAHDRASAWNVNQAFERVLYDALPDWSDDDQSRGDLHTAMRGSLQLIASTLLHQSTQQAAGRHEMYEGINRIIERREEGRRKREEEYQAYLRSIRPATKKRKEVKARKQRAKSLPPARVARPIPKPPPPGPEAEPEPKPVTTYDYLKINAQRIREGKEPI